MEHAAAQASSPVPVAFTDGLGVRRHTSDPSGKDTLEVLRVRRELTVVPSFEFALRERVSRLASFRHASFARVRSVERLGDRDGSLAIVSERAAGVRLSEVLEQAHAMKVGLDIGTALCFVRQLVPAVAVLHEAGRDLAHGAIAPERLILTHQARLVVVEYVLGAALEQLRLPHERYWRELRIAVPSAGPAIRFDQRADVMQVGIVALSLILGRPLQDDEYLTRLGDLVASTWATSARGGFEPLPQGLRVWLTRALQIDRTGFSSAVEARAELEKVVGTEEYVVSPASVEAFLARLRGEDRSVGAAMPPLRPGHAVAMPPATGDQLEPLAGGLKPSAPVPPASPLPPAPVSPVVPVAAVAALAPAVPVAHVIPVAPLAPVEASVAPVVAEVMPAAVEPASAVASTPTPPRMPELPVRRMFDEPVPIDAVDPEPFDAEAPPRRPWPRRAAMVAVLVALAGGGLFAARGLIFPAAAPRTGTLVVTSTPSGAEAFVDGTLKGTTPLSVGLFPGPHMVELRSDGTSRSLPVSITAGAEVAQNVDFAAETPLAVAPEPSPVDQTAIPGQHAAVAPVARTEPGAVSALAPTAAVPGWIAIESPIEVQVFEQDRLLGTSKGERIALGPGRHEIELRNDALGYRLTRSIQVGAGKASPVAVEAPRGTLALNAVPWAAVWVDGEPAGETPIGNLPLSIGSHSVVFWHPELGEQHHTVTVTLKEVARLSVDLRQR